MKNSAYWLKIGVAALLSLLAFGPYTVRAGTTGKISGRITETTKSEGLAGANIVLTGTNLGAATDIDGYYAILNVPPGRYEIQMRLIGYRTYVVKEVHVSADNTTKLDAALQESVVAADEVVVTAQRPVVQVNLTSTIATVSDKEIKSLPVQELADIVNLQAGVVDGHFRGGRDGEVQYQVNGVSVNNVYDNTSSIKIDRSLIQEVQVVTGTFDAEYGQAMSGVVNTVLKSGGEGFDWNAEVYGGGFLYESGGKRNLTYKAHPFSTQSFQANISGPVGLPETYFLVSGRRHVFDDYLYATRTYKPVWAPIRNSQGQITGYDFAGDGKEVPLGYKRDWSGLARITNKSIRGIEFSYQMLYNYTEGVNADIAWIQNPDGRKTQKTLSYVHGLDVTHVLSQSTLYTISLHQNVYDYKDWVYEDFNDARYDAAGSPITMANSNIVQQGVQFDRFRQKTESYIARFALTSQATRDQQIKIGGEFQYSKMQFGTPGTLVYLTEGGVTKLVRYVDNPPDYPGVQIFHPISASAYVQDLIEWNDLTIRAGVRFEYFNARGTLPGDLANPANAISGVSRVSSRCDDREDIGCPTIWPLLSHIRDRRDILLVRAFLSAPSSEGHVQQFQL